MTILRRYQTLLLGIATIIMLYASRQYSYLLFHSLVELFSIVVAFCVFVIAWNARRLYSNEYLLLIGIASFFVGFLDLVHTLGYKGMGVFIGYDANLSTQLWIAARSLESISLLVAPLLLGTRIRSSILLAVYTGITAVLLGTIFLLEVFPICYIDTPGGGLTSFKIISEYVICGILVISLILLRLKRARFDVSVLHYLTAAVLLTIAAEVSFTAYISVYGMANMLGHLFKLLSFYCLYKAIVQTALVRPMNLLFREIKQREEELIVANRLQEKMTQFLVHDLRSPLTSVITGIDTLQLLKRSDLTPEDTEILDSASASAAWLITLADTMLSVARLNTNKMPMQLKELAVQELFDIALQQTKVLAKASDISLEKNIKPENAIIVADRELTVRILVNLLSNAIKHGPPGSKVRLEGKSRDNNLYVITVSDEGAGIPSEWAEKIFERYVTTEARASGATGAGLGLHFCRLAVEAQKGRIWADTTVEHGASIAFTLPRFVIDK